MMRALLSMVCLACALAGCGSADTEGVPVELDLTFEAVTPSSGSKGEIPAANGWTVHLDEAVVLLGPVYLRGPRRERSAWVDLLIPVAHAHGDHAQTLTEGQIIGEYLEQVAFDALSEQPLSPGLLVAESVPLDRVSIVLDPPRGYALSETTGGFHARVRGTAQKGERLIPFSCGLTIGDSTSERPQDLEARRRVDQIKLPNTPQVREGGRLRIGVHVERWFEFVDFDTYSESEIACSAPTDPFVAQWYLGIRRPEAFSAEFEE